MIYVDMKVKILPHAEYNGKYTGCVGVVRKYLTNGKKVGVLFEDVRNSASATGVFWFSEAKVEIVESAHPEFEQYIETDLAVTLQAFNERSRRSNPCIPTVKKVITNGPKTIVLWGDGTKTIVSCGADETFDPYAGFCAAVVKKVFGSTSHAKKVLKQTLQDQNG